MGRKQLAILKRCLCYKDAVFPPNILVLAVCVSQEEYDAVRHHMGDYRVLKFLDGAIATTTHFSNSERGRLACIVCLDPQHSAYQTIGSIVHEATHVFQQFCAFIGEKDPGEEYQAYSMQALVQMIMIQYCKLTGRPDPSK